jgi:hypothetical protein
VEWVRRPEYTGENRCQACTLVNVGVTGAVSVALAAVVSGLLGVLVFVLGAVAIYFRGYVVPGTPTFTRHLPDRVLRMFDHHEPTTGLEAKESTTDGGAPEAQKSPEALLLEAGALTECEDLDDLCLHEEFRAVWYEHMDDVRRNDDLESLIRSELDSYDGDLTIRNTGEEIVVYTDDEPIAHWSSTLAAVADFGAKRALAASYPQWTTFDVEYQSTVTRSLRAFLDRCPSCDTLLTAAEDTSCCFANRARMQIYCPDCESVLFESTYAEPEAAGSDEPLRQAMEFSPGTDSEES